MIANEPLLLRVREVANLLRIGDSTAYALVAANKLPTVRIGRTVRIPREGLLAWIENQTAGALSDRVVGR